MIENPIDGQKIFAVYFNNNKGKSYKIEECIVIREVGPTMVRVKRTELSYAFTVYKRLCFSSMEEAKLTVKEHLQEKIQNLYRQLVEV